MQSFSHGRVRLLIAEKVFFYHQTKEVEEVLLAESKKLSVRDFQRVVSRMGIFLTSDTGILLYRQMTDVDK